MNTSAFIEKLKIILYKIHQAYGDLDNFVMDGCTVEEIEEVMKQQNVTFLPQLYRSFLLEMGNGRPAMFPGSAYVYSALRRLKERAVELASETHPSYRLPEAAFVFLGHGGYLYYFFLTNDQNENPPIYVIDENNEDIVICCDTLSEFFLNLGQY